MVAALALPLKTTFKLYVQDEVFGMVTHDLA